MGIYTKQCVGFLVYYFIADVSKVGELVRKPVLMFANGIKLKADRLYKRLVCGGLLLGCVSGVRRAVCKLVF